MRAVDLVKHAGYSESQALIAMQNGGSRGSKGKLDITKKQAEDWALNGGETNFWMIAPSDVKGGHISKKPSCPKGFRIFDADPQWKGQKYWHIKKAV